MILTAYCCGAHSSAMLLVLALEWIIQTVWLADRLEDVVSAGSDS